MDKKENKYSRLKSLVGKDYSRILDTYFDNCNSFFSDTDCPSGLIYVIAEFILLNKDNKKKDIRSVLKSIVEYNYPECSDSIYDAIIEEALKLRDKANRFREKPKIGLGNIKV